MCYRTLSPNPSQGQRGLALVLERLEQPRNIGAALRTCEALGVETELLVTV